MKITNFNLIKTMGDTLINRKFVATIDVQTGILFWKKKSTKKIIREYGCFWFFADTGEFTPSRKVENLERAFIAMQECK